MRVSLLVFAVLLTACSKSPVKEVAAPTPAPQGASIVEPPSATLSLFERLAKEGETRDKADPPTSKVIAAFTAAGLTLADQRQQSAASLGASFCVMLSSAEHVTLSICEFPDPQSAKVGAATSRKALQQIAGRTVDVKRSTILAVIDSQADAASALVTQKARAAFDAL